MNFRKVITVTLIGCSLTSPYALAAGSAQPGQGAREKNEQAPVNVVRDCAQSHLLDTLRHEYGLPVKTSETADFPPCAAAISPENGE